MVENKKVQAENLKKDEDVRRALEQTAGNKPDKKTIVEPKQKLWIGTYLLLLAGLGVFYYLLRLGYFDFAVRYIPPLQRLTLGTMGVVLVLFTLKLVKVYLIDPLDNGAARYILSRIANLVAGLIVVFIALSMLFANWYTAVVSFGLISLVLGFALQAPITSFIGWVYILWREPYRVGDRIRIGTATGDVIDVGYLDTTLWEVGGDYLSTQHPSARVLKFPNSPVLNTPVYNYTWPLFPYVWNEIKFPIAYNSDLDFVSTTMQEVASQEVSKAMMKHVRVFRELLAQTPVNQLEVQERPVVMFRVAENSWLEVIVRYLVPPKEAGRVKNRLIKKLLARLNAEPDRVKFPRGDMR